MRTLVLSLVMLSGCGAQFKPETLVDALRVLAIGAEPPEVAPGQNTSLNIIQLDPSRPGGVTTVVWVGCEPDPIDFNRSACNDTTALLQPTSFTDFPPGVRLLGIGNSANYASSASLFNGVAADDAVRFNGTSGPALAVVIGDYVDPTADNAALRELFTKVENQQIQSVFALTRVTVTERAQKNQNPAIDTLKVDGVRQPKFAKLQVHEGQTVQLEPVPAEGARETYTVRLPTGDEQRTEELVASWYSTAGRFSVPRVDLASTTVTTFTAPGATSDDPVPAKRTAQFWTVLRDGRGGLSSDARSVYVCDDSATPKATGVTAPVNMGDAVLVNGSDLANVLDVVVGDEALQHGSYSNARNAYVADPPVTLMSGDWPVRLRTKNCQTVETGLTYHQP